MKTIIFGLLVFPMLGYSQSGGLVINGTVNGLADNSKVYLTNGNNASDTAGTAVVKGGKFMLKGKLPEPGIYEINFNGPQKKLPLFIGNDNIAVSGSVSDLKSIKVTGSSSNDDFVNFQQTFNPSFSQITSLTQLLQSSAGSPKYDSLVKVYKEIVSSIQAKTDQFIGARKSSFVSPFALLVVNQLTEDVFVQEKRLLSLSPQVQDGFFGKYLKDQIDMAKVGAIGTDEIDFTQNDTTGKPVTLSSFKGKYVLVDFWASWCHPCRLENPNVVNTYGKFRNKNFTILSVSLDRARDPWLKAIQDDHLTWSHVSDLKFWNNEVAVKYKVQSIPQNFLIDPTGKIIAKNLRGPELEMKLCELIGCN